MCPPPRGDTIDEGFVESQDDAVEDAEQLEEDQRPPALAAARRQGVHDLECDSV